MPAEQALGCKRLGVFFGRVEHHLDDALDVTVGRSEPADIHAEAARERGAHLTLVEDFALDLARLQDFLGERLKGRLSLQPEAKRLHPSDQAPLAVTDRGESVREAFMGPAKLGPAGQLVDVSEHSPHLMRRIWSLFPIKARAISAGYAENNPLFSAQALRVWLYQRDQAPRAQDGAAIDEADQDQITHRPKRDRWHRRISRIPVNLVDQDRPWRCAS